jgi:dTDP-4-dehydrorhamnose reductase
MDTNRSRILVLGASGLLGSNWSRFGRRNGRLIFGSHRMAAHLQSQQSVLIDFSSVRGLVDCFKSLGVSSVVNLVALTDVDACEVDHERAFAVNVGIAERVALACGECGCGLVQFSTDQVFDGSESMYSEESPPNPINCYGTTKLEAESRVFAQAEKVLVVRTNFFGWGTKSRMSFSDMIIRHLANRERLELWDDVMFTPLYMREVITAVEALLEENKTGLFHLGGLTALSKHQFGLEVASIFGFDVSMIGKASVERAKLLAKRPANMSLSSRKFTSLGIAKLSTASEGLAAMKADSIYQHTSLGE